MKFAVDAQKALQAKELLRVITCKQGFDVSRMKFFKTFSDWNTG